jgi:hypothetical protein
MDIALSETHDIFVTNSDLTLTNEENFIVQSLKIRLQFILSEWFLDTFVGLPYPTVIFERLTSIGTIYSLYSKEILDTNGVQEIITLALTPFNDERKLQVDFTVKQDNGIVISEQIIIEV